MNRRRAAGLVLALLVALTTTGCFLSSGEPVEVEVEDGTLRGVASGGVRSWLGIPYAAPPVGDLRWQPPQPVDDWDETRDVDEYGDSCLQLPGTQVERTTSEDCLHLNVFRPDDDTEDLPVMVWIHGGGFTSGSGDLTPEMAQGLVDHDVVLVSINYRLGRLGYFAHPALAEEARARGEQPIANYGLLDQVAALEWVQDNIGAFGGDPDAVTVFGISAGGASVNYLMTSPLADGLFARAIAGSGFGRERLPSWNEAAAQGRRMADDLGAGDAEELRDLDADEVAALPALFLAEQIPVADASLPRPVWQAFGAGDEAEIPYLVGHTEVEIVDDHYPLLGVNPDWTRDRLVAGRERAAAGAYGEPAEVEAHLLNDLVFSEPARFLARQHSRRAPAYRYRFSVADPVTRERYGGALHGADLPYIFGVGIPGVRGSEELAEVVSTCWASFAAVGVPSCGDVAWPLADTGGFVEFTNEGPQVVSDDPWAARLDLAESIAEATS